MPTSTRKKKPYSASDPNEPALPLSSLRDVVPPSPPPPPPRHR